MALYTVASATHAQREPSPEVCGSLANGDNGPFDYQTERGPRLKIIEEHHFNARVEALLSGQTGSLEHDLDYLLRAFPNHPRGLLAVSRLTIRNGGVSKDPAVRRTADCYFERAMRWRPEDTMVRMLYARYLHSTQRTDAAIRQLTVAAELGANNPLTQHNVGLVFADMGQWDRAAAQAKKARAMGFERADLVNKIRSAGKWSEPTESRDGDAAQSGAASAAATVPSESASAASAPR